MCKSGLVQMVSFKYVLRNNWQNKKLLLSSVLVVMLGLGKKI